MRVNGFTLIEVLIALAIFTLIGLATVRQIDQIATTKAQAFQELDVFNSIRSALGVIQNDINQTFHVLYDDLGEETKTAVIQNQPAPHTIFDGRKNELVLTTLSHRVFYKGLRECEQTEISYFLQRRQGKQTSSLMKRESQNIDADLYQGGSVYTILDSIESLEFQYWDDKAGRWIDDWNSDGGEYRDRFPLAVKLKMVVIGRQNKPIEVKTEFKVAFPNNDPYIVQF